MVIDGRPALSVFTEDIGPGLASDLRRVGGLIFAGLPVAGSDTGDYLVRNLMAIDPGRGWLVLGAEIVPGDTILFCRRDPKRPPRHGPNGKPARRADQRPAQRRGSMSVVSRGVPVFGDPGSKPS